MRWWYDAASKFGIRRRENLLQSISSLESLIHHLLLLMDLYVHLGKLTNQRGLLLGGCFALGFGCGTTYYLT